MVLFFAAWLGQGISEWQTYTAEQHAHGESVKFGGFVTEFGQSTLENWQSEWLQFWLFALATVWFVQKGSNESKKQEDAGLETDERQRVGLHAPEDAPRWAKARDWRLTVYSYSFTIVMGAIFLATWLGQSVTSLSVYNDEQAAHARIVASGSHPRAAGP